MDLDQKNRPGKKLIYAIPLVLAAGLCVACMAAVVKTGSSHLSAASMVFWRNLVSLVILLPFLALAKPAGSIKDKLKTKEWRLHLIRGVSSFLSVYLYFYSLKYLDLTSATLLFNTIPIFVPIVAFFWQRIAIYHSLWWAIGLAFLGIVLILNPGVRFFHFASFLALLSGVVGAISLVSLRFGHYSETPVRMLFFLFLLCTLCSFLFTLFSWKESWDFQPKDFLLLIFLGVFGFLYQVSMTVAAKFAPIRLLSPFLYASVIFTMIFDKLFWHASFTLLSLSGFLLVAAGAFLMLALYPKDDLQIKPKK